MPPAIGLTGRILALGLAASFIAMPVAFAQTAPTVVQAAPGQAVVVQPLPPSRWTLQQARQAFELADSDANGELSRAEGQRLTILPRSFEEMDANKDGVLARAEYEAVFQR
jgi:hypothetical protein